jgi:hypothetical protein
MAIAETLISALGALTGAGVGGYAAYKASGPYWERAKLEAVAPLVEARIAGYEDLWHLTDYGTEARPYKWDNTRRFERAAELRTWYYRNAGGLLLSDAARRQWTTALDALESGHPSHPEIRLAMSCLRTRLKQDVHVHGPFIDETKCLTPACSCLSSLPLWRCFSSSPLSRSYCSSLE